MPKRQIIGVVTSDKMNKTRRVEIARLVRHPKYGKFMRRRTVCHVHDENNESHDRRHGGDHRGAAPFEAEALGLGADRHRRASRSISRPCGQRPSCRKPTQPKGSFSRPELLRQSIGWRAQTGPR